MRSAQVLHQYRPFVLPFIAGLFALEVGDLLSLRWRPVSIVVVWLGECLLVFAVARRLHLVSWIGRRRFLAMTLWVLNAAISATFAVRALDYYRAYRDPNTWLLLESRPLNWSKAPLLAGDGYYLLDLSSDSDLAPKKADREESLHVMHKLEGQARLSKEGAFDYVMVSKFTNAGAKRLLIKLPVTVTYEGIWQKDLPVPSPRHVQIPVQPLNPGESYEVIIFSTDPDRYASFSFPDAVPVQWDDSGELHPLQINYVGDNEIYRAAARQVVVSGVRIEPAPSPPNRP